MKKQFVRLALAIVVIGLPLTARAQTISGKLADPVTGEPAAVSKRGGAEPRKIDAGPVGNISAADGSGNTIDTTASPAVQVGAKTVTGGASAIPAQ
jgi:hypothetical protein